MQVKEFIDLVNSNNEHFDSLFDFEHHFKKITGLDLPEKVEEGVDLDPCEYYCRATTIYKLEDGFVGVDGISEVYASDFDEFWDKCEAYEYEQVPAMIFRVKMSD